MKFRVFNKSKNEHQNSDNYFLSAKGELFEECKMDGILLNVDKGDKIVQFSTGLFDIEGVEIFEGDLIEWQKYDIKSDVVYSPKLASFVLDTSGRHLIDDKYGDYCPMHYEYKYKIIKQ